MIDKNGFRFTVQVAMSVSRAMSIVTIEWGDMLTFCTVQKSNCLQANVYLKKELFTRFDCEGKHQFGINLTLLLECLSVFGTSSGSQVALQINYAGEGHPILLQMVDGEGLLFVSFSCPYRYCTKSRCALPSPRRRVTPQFCARLHPPLRPNFQFVFAP